MIRNGRWDYYNIIQILKFRHPKFRIVQSLGFPAAVGIHETREKSKLLKQTNKKKV